MRVVVVSPWSEEDPETVVGAPDQARLIAAMRQRNWDVSLVRPFQGRGLGRIRPLFWPLELLVNLFAIPGRVRKHDPDLVLCLDGKAGLGACAAGALSRARVVGFQHGIKDFSQGLVLPKLKNPDVLVHKALPIRVFWVEDGSGAWAMAGPKDITLAPAHDGVLPGPEPRPKTFGFVGRAHGIKGLRDFARVARRVLERVPDARCLVMGPGHESGPLRQWAVGSFPQKHAAKHIRRLRVLCSTNPYGNFTLPVVEAMAQGTVPVVFDVGNTRQMLQGAGVVVKNRDVEAMVEEVVRLLEDQQLYLDKSQACIQRAKGLASWDQRLEKTLHHLEKFCSQDS